MTTDLFTVAWRESPHPMSGERRGSRIETYSRRTAEIDSSEKIVRNSRGSAERKLNSTCLPRNFHVGTVE